MIGLVAVAAMFSTGVALFWVGIRRRPDRLPAGADDVLVAVMEGRLARPDHVIDLVHPPASPPRAASAKPAVRLLPKGEAPAPEAVPTGNEADSTAEHPSPVIVASQSEPAKDTPPRVESPSADEPEPVATPAGKGETLFEGIDDPSTPESAFFATKPQLQRF